MVRQYSSWKKNTTTASQSRSGTSRTKQNRTLTTTTTATTTITSTLNESVVHLESIDNSERLDSSWRKKHQWYASTLIVNQHSISLKWNSSLGVISDTLKYIIVKGLSLLKWIKSLGLNFLQIYQCRKRRWHLCHLSGFWNQFCIYSNNWDMGHVCLNTDLVSSDARFCHWMHICVNLQFIVTSIFTFI